jgi:hypothetical protein
MEHQIILDFIWKVVIPWPQKVGKRDRLGKRVEVTFGPGWKRADGQRSIMREPNQMCVIKAG